MYKRAVADKGIVPLSYRRRSTPALCHSQNERSRPRKRRNNIPNSNGKTPVLCNFQSVRLFRRTRTHSTARFASALPAAKGRTNTPFPFVLESPIYKSFRRKKPAPALHTAIYHTRRKRRLTAAVRLCKNGRHSPACFLAFVCFDAFGKKPQSGLARTTGTVRLDRDADAVPLVFLLLYALTHSARSRSPAWRGQQAQPRLFSPLFYALTLSV